MIFTFSKSSLALCTSIFVLYSSNLSPLNTSARPPGPRLKPGTTTSACYGFSSADIHPCTNDIWYQVSPVMMLWCSAEIALMATFYDLISKPFRVLIYKLIRLVVFYWTSMVCSMMQYCFYISDSLLKDSRPLKIRICWHDVKRWNAAVE